MESRMGPAVRLGIFIRSFDRSYCGYIYASNIQLVQPETRWLSHRPHMPLTLVSYRRFGVCAKEECKRKAYYGSDGDKRATYCSLHKKIDHVNVITKRCEHPDCRTIPSFGCPIDRIKRFCAKHKRPTDENVRTVICQHPGCRTHATFGPSLGSNPLHCAKHRPEVGFNLGRRLCLAEGCRKPSSHGVPLIPLENVPRPAGFALIEPGEEGLEFPAGSTPAWIDYREPNATEKTTRIVIEVGKWLWCAPHAPVGAVNLVTKRCEAKNCRTVPSFTAVDDTTARRCKEHRLPLDVNVRTPAVAAPTNNN